ncbi:MAG: hypothetical protein EBQ68_06010 [Betaproteobacteria bacterium]|nr:hypothetical protein [Betaproteobacteria bacterium]
MVFLDMALNERDFQKCGTLLAFKLHIQITVKYFIYRAIWFVCKFGNFGCSVEISKLKQINAVAIAPPHLLILD